MGGVPRWVLHLDLDAFFPSVEQLTRPTLRGRPVLVGGAGPRGTVAGASYEARVFGARSAMSMAHARGLCPHATVVPPRFAVYQAASERVFAVVGEVASVLEHISLDEAFCEPPALADAGVPEVGEFAERLRTRIREEVGLTASIGVGSGKQLAKIASELAKPDGVLVVPHGAERQTLAGLPVRALWGVGPVAESKLRRIGVTTVGQLAEQHLSDITSLLGRAVGTALRQLARGVDHRPVGERAESKQVSAETTFDVDVSDLGGLTAAATAMAEHAYRRLIAAGRAARTVTIKVKTRDFSVISRSESMSAATTDRDALIAAVRRLVRVARPTVPVRLIGVSLSGLSDTAQEPLFPKPAAEVEDLPMSAAPTEPVRGDGWRAGDDVTHPEYGHGWVQGAGVGRVSVRFETADTGPGRALTFDAEDTSLRRADPCAALPEWSP